VRLRGRPLPEVVAAPRVPRAAVPAPRVPDDEEERVPDEVRPEVVPVRSLAVDRPDARPEPALEPPEARPPGEDVRVAMMARLRERLARSVERHA
jgi:hypothetical protein